MQFFISLSISIIALWCAWLEWLLCLMLIVPLIKFSSYESTLASPSEVILLAIPVGDAIWDCRHSFFFLFFSATIMSGPYFWYRYSQRLQIECAAWSCGLILHCCLPSNSLCYFFFFFIIFFFFPATILPQFCMGRISGTVTRRDSKLSVLLGPAV